LRNICYFASQEIKIGEKVQHEILSYDPVAVFRLDFWENCWPETAIK
jgi:hypothetical protein